MKENNIIFQQFRILTTAEILYHLPDFPELLQTYLWQENDLVPSFPKLRGFLDYWSKNLDGKLHSVKVCHADLDLPHEFSFADIELTKH